MREAQVETVVLRVTMDEVGLEHKLPVKALFTQAVLVRGVTREQVLGRAAIPSELGREF